MELGFQVGPGSEVNIFIKSWIFKKIDLRLSGAWIFQVPTSDENPW